MKGIYISLGIIFWEVYLGKVISIQIKDSISTLCFGIEVLVDKTYKILFITCYLILYMFRVYLYWLKCVFFLFVETS